MQTAEATAPTVPGRLAGRVAIVTGAGHGMGAAIVSRFVGERARVVALDIAGDRLAAYAQLSDVAALECDVTVAGAAEKAVALAVERFGKLDVLVNNAGIMDAFAPVGDVTDETWAHVLAVNLTAPMALTRAAIPRMVAAGGGAIVNIASIGGIRGGRAGAAYTASKHGLIGLTQSTAVSYLKEGIRCNAVSPGGVDTGIPIGGAPNPRGYAVLNATLATNPGVGKADDIASVVAFLASSEAAFVNGAVVVADGGWTAY